MLYRHAGLGGCSAHSTCCRLVVVTVKMQMYRAAGRPSRSPFNGDSECVKQHEGQNKSPPQVLEHPSWCWAMTWFLTTKLQLSMERHQLLPTAATHTALTCCITRVSCYTHTPGPLLCTCTGMTLLPLLFLSSVHDPVLEGYDWFCIHLIHDKARWPAEAPSTRVSASTCKQRVPNTTTASVLADITGRQSITNQHLLAHNHVIQQHSSYSNTQPTYDNHLLELLLLLAAVSQCCPDLLV